MFKNWVLVGWTPNGDHGDENCPVSEWLCQKIQGSSLQFKHWSQVTTAILR